jgi:GT2 family glycosyltransferase
LRSIANLDKSGFVVHVIVVDDGSTDGIADEIRRAFPDVQIIRGDGSLSYAGGTNIGILSALTHNSDYVLAMKDDSILHESSLKRMISCAQQHPRSIIGALLLLWDKPHQVCQVAAQWDTWYGGWRHPQHLTTWTIPKDAFDVDLIAGNCVLYPVEAMRQNGFMRSDVMPNWTADVEYTIRMKKAGWRLLIEPGASVWCESDEAQPPTKSSGLKSLVEDFFVDSRSPRNLLHLFHSRWHTAPSRFSGLTAFLFTLVHLSLHAFRLGNWPKWPDPMIR